MLTIILAACAVEEDKPRWQCSSRVVCGDGSQELEGPTCADTMEEAIGRHRATLAKWVTENACPPQEPDTVTCVATGDFCVVVD